MSMRLTKKIIAMCFAVGMTLMPMGQAFANEEGETLVETTNVQQDEAPEMMSESEVASEAEKVIECEDAASNADHGSQGADADAYDTAGSHHADAAGDGYAGDVDEIFAEAQITSAPFTDNPGQTIGWIGDQLHIDAHGNADASHYDGDDQHDKTCRKRWIRQSQTLQEKVKTCIKELQEQAEGHGKRQLQPVGPLSGFSFQKDFDQCKRCIHQERQKGEVEVPDL